MSQGTFGQGPTPYSGDIPPELDRLSDRLVELTERLGREVSEALGQQSPNGNDVIRDVQELQQSTHDFRNILRGQRDLFRAQQIYSGIDTTWRRLRRELDQLGGQAPDVVRIAGRIVEVNSQIRQTLRMKAPPQDFYGNGPAPTGINETQRIAYSLVDRAQALAVVARNQLATAPDGPTMIQEAEKLVQLAGRFYDALNQGMPIEQAAASFRPVDVSADRIEHWMAANPVPPDVQRTWQGFASVEILIHNNLGLSSPQPQVPISFQPNQPGGPSPVLGLAAQLDQQTDAFVDAFSPTAGTVPEGGLILNDAQRLQSSTDQFRRVVSSSNDPGQLAYAFREVEGNWQRLARRINRIAQGRFGPNIELAQAIGQTYEQIHRILGMPGYVPP